ncbi:unnamed protein product [Prorocentrum cordatum]|uniref:Uncharacterized protein n=1 Tax=Prorocentrum cordatum TaxID=2364126 RepID=A0ABN9QH44_9DINO|nr:unnamed protein product [Polarella glacialis]
MPRAARATAAAKAIPETVLMDVATAVTWGDRGDRRGWGPRAGGARDGQGGRRSRRRPRGRASDLSDEAATSRGIEWPGRFVAKSGPEYANFLAETRRAKDEVQRRARGENLAVAMKSHFEEHMLQICVQSFGPQSVAAPPSAGPGGLSPGVPLASGATTTPFPPVPPTPPTAPVSLSQVAKAWLQSLVGAATVPPGQSMENIANFFAECIFKGSEAKERVRLMIVLGGVGKFTRRHFKQRAPRAADILYGPE